MEGGQPVKYTDTKTPQECCQVTAGRSLVWIALEAAAE